MTTQPKTTTPTGLALLRQPVEDRYIAQLPKPTKKQTEEVKADFTKGIRCKVCHTWHHPAVVHLDYVGHAATTARLLEADEQWTWEPMALTEEGLPRTDKDGGMWIRLTVCGTSRLGYGNADPKPNADAGSRMKEVIGDAIRNAAMRFGWALELWHKGGDLFLPSPHDDDDAGAGGSERPGEGGQRCEPMHQHPDDGAGRDAPANPYAGPTKMRVSDEERVILSRVASGLQKSYAAEGALRAAQRLIESALDSDQELAVWGMISGDQHTAMRNDVKQALQQLRTQPKDETK